jgi:hypothetical protein
MGVMLCFVDMWICARKKSIVKGEEKAEMRVIPNLSTTYPKLSPNTPTYPQSYPRLIHRKLRARGKIAPLAGWEFRAIGEICCQGLDLWCSDDYDKRQKNTWVGVLCYKEGVF